MLFLKEIFILIFPKKINISMIAFDVFEVTAEKIFSKFDTQRQFPEGNRQQLDKARAFEMRRYISIKRRKALEDF